MLTEGLVLMGALAVMWAPCFRKAFWTSNNSVYAKDRKNRTFVVTAANKCYCHN